MKAEFADHCACVDWNQSGLTGESDAENNGTTREVMWQHMQIYLAYGGVNSFGMLLGLFSLTIGCIRTSTSLHNKMLDAILRAPMSFFDSTPTGRILNR